MPMTFWWGTKTTILFEFWQTKNAADYFLSCACIFALAMANMVIKSRGKRGGFGLMRPIQPIVLPSGDISNRTQSLAIDSRPSVSRQHTPIGAMSPLGVSKAPYHLHSEESLNLSFSSVQRYTVGPENRKIRTLFATFLVTLLVISIDWSLMLVCMTFNVGLFLSVVCGIAVGSFMVRASERSLTCSNSASFCHSLETM